MGNNEKTFTIPDALQLLAKKKLKLEEEEEGLSIRVNQDTRLDNRVLDLRTPTNQVITIILCTHI